MTTSVGVTRTVQTGTLRHYLMMILGTLSVGIGGAAGAYGAHHYEEHPITFSSWGDVEIEEYYKQYNMVAEVNIPTEFNPPKIVAQMGIMLLLNLLCVLYPIVMINRLSPTEAMQSGLASGFLALFLIMPVMVPLTIAAYSIVGEKVARSLEPLLATPITTTELLLGKSLAAAVPGVVMAWVAYVLFLLVSRFLVVSDRVFAVFTDPMWLVAMFVLAPLLTIMAVNVGIIGSSRTNDPRAAEQLGSLLILPLMALFVGPMAGLMTLNATTFWACAGIVAVLDVGLLYLAVSLFQRETILTRWK